jgi:hypothetical protein
LAKELQAAHPDLPRRSCYEAGQHPDTSGPCRLLRRHHYDCILVAPSKLPRPMAPARRAALFSRTRNLWCAAVFGALANHELVRDGARYVSKPRPPNATPDPALRNALLAFDEVDVRITNNGTVKYGPHPDAHKLRRFVVRDPANYARGMTEATAGVLATLGKAAPSVR